MALLFIYFLNPRNQRFNIARGIATGLCFLHSHKIVHGDFKSANILLDRQFEPKITDFGLTNYCKDNETILEYFPSNFSQTDSICGTTIDVFCYGMILFDLMTGT